MLADEITTDLRAIRAQAIAQAAAPTVARSRTNSSPRASVTAPSAPIRTGRVKTRGVRGVDPDLRVRPFFAHGGTTSIREFVVGAFNDEMGLQAVDPLLLQAAAGARIEDADPHGARRIEGRRQDGHREDGSARILTAMGSKTRFRPRSSTTWSSIFLTTSSREHIARTRLRGWVGNS